MTAATPAAAELLSAFPGGQARPLGFHLLADLALGPFGAQRGQSVDNLVMLVADVAQSPPV